MANLNLSSILSPIIVNDVISSFEVVVDLKSRILITDLDGVPYFGSPCPDCPYYLKSQIVVDGNQLGFVLLYPEVENLHMDAAVKHLGVLFSALATETWRRNQLAEEVLERYDELNLIYGLGVTFSQGLPQDEIVKDVLLQTNRIIRADAGVIYIWDPEQSHLVPVSFFGDKSNSDFWDGRLRELALSTLYAYEEAQLFDTDRVICAPLRYNDELLGALVLLYEREGKTFNANDVNLLTALTHNTALFIHAARLFDQLTQRKNELEKALIELKSTKDKLSRAERLSIIGQTMSSLVHDMKNPLAIILGYASILEDEDVTYDQRKEYAGEIIKYVNVFSSMSQEILEYTQGEENIRTTPTRVVDFLDYVKNLVMPPGLPRAVPISIYSDPVRECVVSIDQQKLGRVFQNLVNNAVDAIESKGGSKILIEADSDGDDIIFTITDDGPGIPDHIAEKMFEPFVTHGKSHGTGLGLAIVDRIISNHKGSIVYQPAPNGGARFIVKMPQTVPARAVR